MKAKSLRLLLSRYPAGSRPESSVGGDQSGVGASKPAATARDTVSGRLPPPSMFGSLRHFQHIPGALPRGIPRR